MSDDDKVADLLADKRPASKGFVWRQIRQMSRDVAEVIRVARTRQSSTDELLADIEQRLAELEKRK